MTGMAQLKGGVAFYVLAVLLAAVIDRALRKALGYQAHKASLQALRRSSTRDVSFPQSFEGPKEPIAPESEIMDAVVVQKCPHCGSEVVPNHDGSCPACQKRT
jgi:hypothetical protein